MRKRENGNPCGIWKTVTSSSPCQEIRRKIRRFLWPVRGFHVVSFNVDLKNWTKPESFGRRLLPVPSNLRHEAQPSRGLGVSRPNGAALGAAQGNALGDKPPTFIPGALKGRPKALHPKDLIAPTGLENKRGLPSFPGALPRATPRAPLQGSKRIQPRRTHDSLFVNVIFDPDSGELRPFGRSPKRRSKMAFKQAIPGVRWCEEGP
jgi:hypothetical protein